jgi:LysR family glycine cleavage system transcriptional activator
MTDRVLPLRGISVFEAAARAESFHAAAEELNLTPSAVSHQIRLLEAVLGVKLFDRVGRGVTLTPEGAEYARSVRHSIRWLRAATSDMRARGQNGSVLDVVRIEAPPSFAHSWILPRLADLMSLQPGIDIRLNAQGSSIQGERLPWEPLVDAPADIQIVYGGDIWKDRASLMLRETFQPFCAPDLLEPNAFESPQALLSQTLISTFHNHMSWEEWLNLQGVQIDRNPVNRLQLDPSYLAIQAAAGGLGIVLESSILVQRELSSGALVAPFPHLVRPGLGYWIFTPSTKRLSATVGNVIDWLMAGAGSDK